MPPILTPTLEIEIADKRAEIATHVVQPSRTQRVLIVQPLKDELAALIEQNEEIKAANKIIEDTPTAEELIQQTADERRQNIKTDIRIEYPDISDEVQVIRMILAEEFPNNTRAQTYNDKIEAILSKYPKV